ncbi:hypothetical protein, partial [Streptomyces sp. NPDC058457]|uniref:hypothetical protein n=1 Tax=Streptomyces sp. NPDC058457 TaxID=3346507 RepID=UPI00365D4370
MELDASDGAEKGFLDGPRCGDPCHAVAVPAVRSSSPELLGGGCSGFDVGGEVLVGALWLVGVMVGRGAVIV